MIKRREVWTQDGLRVLHARKERRGGVLSCVDGLKKMVLAHEERRQRNCACFPGERKSDGD